MRQFDDLLAIALDHKGSRDAILAHVVPPKTPDEIAAIPDDRWLSTFAGGIFVTGLSTAMVEKKWPDIEEAFDQFAVAPIAHMSEDRFDALLRDTRIIRSGAKVQAIRDNALLILETSAKHGGFGRFIADWPGDRMGELILWLRKHGSRLGGTVAPYSLRRLGKDTFVPTPSVIARLKAEGVISGAPNSQKAMLAVQEAMNTWAAQSGESLATISAVLAQSIDP